MSRAAAVLLLLLLCACSDADSAYRDDLARACAAKGGLELRTARARELFEEELPSLPGHAQGARLREAARAAGVASCPLADVIDFSRGWSGKHPGTSPE